MVGEHAAHGVAVVDRGPRQRDAARHGFGVARREVVDDRDRVAAGTVSKKDLPRMRQTNEFAEPSGFHIEEGDEDTVEQWMTPAIYTITSVTPLTEAAKKMVKLGIHHLFVKEDHSKKLLGIITTFDLLASLSRALEKNQG